MTILELAGRHCQEVVVCANLRPDWPYSDSSHLCLEATLMVLEDPLAAERRKGVLHIVQPLGVWWFS